MEAMEKLDHWLSMRGYVGALTPITSDASLRSYYRHPRGMVMDASALKESLQPFIEIGKKLTQSGVKIATIESVNLEEGFLFLEDLGSKHLADIPTGDREEYYTKAIDTLVKIQQCDIQDLPAYDAGFLDFEMALMQEWYLEKYLGITPTQEQQTILKEALELIASEVLNQPQGLFVHRDYHSRNLMVTAKEEIAVIDYQDARAGALTYDLVSLLRDVYVAFEPAFVEQMALYFRDAKGMTVDDDTFMRWFDFMGLQRHIKILGIFARLHLRDGKSAYLKDIPLTQKYIVEIGKKYPQLHPFVAMLKQLSPHKGP